MSRNTKKEKSKDAAIARASEEAPITRNSHTRDRDHIGYRDGGLRVDHLTPKARRALGRNMFG